MRFDLIDLRLMVRIAELNSITRAAKASFMSLPAASLRIKHLEQSAGAKLIFRASRGVTLTPVGQAFVHHARLALSQLDQFRDELNEYTKGDLKLLRLAVRMPAFEFLPSELAHFSKIHPDVVIDLRERLSPEIVRSVSEGHTDIGIIAGTVRTEGLETFPYRREKLMLVVPAAHPLKGGAAVSFLDTLQFDHVGTHEGGAMQIFLRQIVDRARRSLRIRVQAGNYETACRMIEANMGIGVMPETTARRYARTLAVRVLPLKDDWAVRDMRVCVRRLESLPDYGQKLVELLSSNARKPRKDGR
jgi:DNA-binding transcriptional LysR family regulator